ncbi:MFS transporter [Companilactobacillus nuruki]|uniref:MFS transporter n=1 Tax=Companilactobacillus nuruki TaxID=1993540 RepID=A0A2N7ASX6_9LACO|nr:MFS transporter [Companilactobacillus nuruki]PMD68784.1 hypothetical protein CBP76_08765 [Companilactobacillus nuruki]
MHKKQKTFLILLTAMNLRLPITAIAPLFGDIQKTLNVNSTVTALLVTIPLFCFSIGAVIAPRLNNIFGIRPLLIFTNGLLLLANILRPITTVTLLLSTFLIGSSIALLNILIPIMVSQTTTELPETTRLTSYYSVTMNSISAIATAIAIPALFAFMISLLPTPFTKPKKDSTTQGLLDTLFYDKIAQRLIIFMGLQSLIFYSLISWLPAIYQSFGASAGKSGILLSIFQFIGIPAAIVLNYFTDTKKILLVLGTGYLIGITTLFWSGIGLWISAIILGFTTSLIFSVALNMIATSSNRPIQIANRSALAQSIGYLLAAIGPVFFGRLHDNFHSWLIILIILAFLMILTILTGIRVTENIKS